ISAVTFCAWNRTKAAIENLPGERSVISSFTHEIFFSSCSEHIYSCYFGSRANVYLYVGLPQYGHTAHVQNFFGVLVGKPWTAHISLGNKQEQQETYRRSLMLSQNLITSDCDPQNVVPPL